MYFSLQLLRKNKIQLILPQFMHFNTQLQTIILILVKRIYEREGCTLKRLLKAAAIIAGIIALIFAGMFIYLNIGMDIKDTEIQSIDLSKVPDGTYQGKYESGRFTNRVELTVKNGKITSIAILDDVTFAKPEVREELFDRIIDKQSLNIEAVSGATATSKAYLKAIENAVSGAAK